MEMAVRAVAWSFVAGVAMTAWLAAGPFAAAGPMQGDAAGQGSGCTLAKAIYTCDRTAFRRALRAAKTVSLETQPRDRVAAGQLRRMAESLGKEVSPVEASGDLTLLLIPVDRNGVLVGPGGAELATLRVYGAAVDGQRGPLLWAESYSGDADRPWPTTVQALIQQFEAKFGKS